MLINCLLHWVYKLNSYIWEKKSLYRIGTTCYFRHPVGDLGIYSLWISGVPDSILY